MCKNGYSFGGEQSSGSHNNRGRQSCATFIVNHANELAKVMTFYPQVLNNVRTSSKIDIENFTGFQKAVKKMEKKKTFRAWPMNLVL